MLKYNIININKIENAKKRIKDKILRTPLVKLNYQKNNCEIYLKLESIQSIGSFKIRGAANKILKMNSDELKNGVWTCSAGNMAQAVAWMARELNINCTAIVPDTAPITKLDSIKRLGADYIKVPFEEFEEIFATRIKKGIKGTMIHPFSDLDVIAGNGTIGIEILEDLPDVDSIIVPYAGGGLICGIGSAIKSLKPETLIYSSEVSTGAPYAASIAQNKPVEVDYLPSFVDGISGSKVFTEMFDLAKEVVDETIVCSLKNIEKAIKITAERNNIIAEGAAGSAIAAAIFDQSVNGKVVCIVSGGNIDSIKLSEIISKDL